MGEEGANLIWTITCSFAFGKGKSGSNAIVQVLQKARTKKVITKTSSTNQENPKK